MLDGIVNAVVSMGRLPLWGLSLVMGYLLGAIPMGYLVAKANGVDILNVGSGSTGGTNVMRTCGKPAGLFVYLLDFAKAVGPVLLLRWLVPEELALHVIVGFIIIVGHSKSIFLGGKGGKSAMSSLGVITALSPFGGLVCAILATTLILTTRIVSIASLTTGTLSGFIMYLFGAPSVYCLFGVLGGIYVWIRHKDNVKRLMAGTENKI
jgi:acyl phosphate:glycerol-3-phosphate acyltransferase